MCGVLTPQDQKTHCAISGIRMNMNEPRLPVVHRKRSSHHMAKEMDSPGESKLSQVAPSPSPVAVPVATPALPAPVPPEPLQRAPGVGWSPSSAVAERTPRKPVPDMCPGWTKGSMPMPMVGGFLGKGDKEKRSQSFLEAQGCCVVSEL